MHIAPVDRSSGTDEWRTFVASQGFGHLIASGNRRAVPEVAAGQFVLEQDDLLLHVVARHPILDAIAEQPAVLMSVAGDWAYIPSDWKTLEGEDPLLGIPTTYLAAVELIGTCSVVEDPDELAELLRCQLRHVQPGIPIADPAGVHRPKLAAIRGLRVAVTEVRARFKFGGNVDAEHRLAVADRLEHRGAPGDQAAAAHTRRRLGPDHDADPGSEI